MGRLSEVVAAVYDRRWLSREGSDGHRPPLQFRPARVNPWLLQILQPGILESVLGFVGAFPFAFFQLVAAFDAPDVAAGEAAAEEEVLVVGIAHAIADVFGAALGARSDEDGVGEVFGGVVFADELAQGVQGAGGHAFDGLTYLLDGLRIEFDMLGLVGLAAAADFGVGRELFTTIPTVHTSFLAYTAPGEKT